MAYTNPKDPRLLQKRREHYYANKNQYLKRNEEAKRQRRIWLAELKESSPCKDCSVYYPSYVMDFDHRDNSNKVANVSTLVTYSWKKLLEEIEKCDLVCANCHRKRTHQRKIDKDKSMG